MIFMSSRITHPFPSVSARRRSSRTAAVALRWYSPPSAALWRHLPSGEPLFFDRFGRRFSRLVPILSILSIPSTRKSRKWHSRDGGDADFSLLLIAHIHIYIIIPFPRLRENKLKSAVPGVPDTSGSHRRQPSGRPFRNIFHLFLIRPLTFDPKGYMLLVRQI